MTAFLLGTRAPPGTRCTVSSAWDALNDNVTWAQTGIPVEDFLYAHNLNQTTEVVRIEKEIERLSPHPEK